MASSSRSDWSILLDVDVDVARIRRQIQQGLNGIDLGSIGSSGQDASLTYTAANKVFGETVQLLEEMVDEVFALDSAITEFKKVSDLRGTGLDENVQGLSEAGRDVARTGKPKRWQNSSVMVLGSREPRRIRHPGAAAQTASIRSMREVPSFRSRPQEEISMPVRTSSL